MGELVVRFSVLKGKSPKIPAAMNEKQRNLIELTIKLDPSGRVKMAFVMDKMNEFAQNEKVSAAP